MDIDDLLAFRGHDFVISEYIKIHQPTLDEIYEYGEKEYFSLVHTLTSTGADLKWQLDSVGIDYTKISDFELFYNMLIKNYSIDQTSILFGNLDFSKFQLFTNTVNNELCLIQQVNEADMIVIDEFTYELIVMYLRKIHYLKRNCQLPANESTKSILIEDAKEEYEINKNKPFKSMLIDLISAMVNSPEFKYDHKSVWDIKIYSFMDSVKRIQKIKNAELLLQSGYSGYGINLKDIKKEELDWLGELK